MTAGLLNFAPGYLYILTLHVLIFVAKPKRAYSAETRLENVESKLVLSAYERTQHVR